MSLRTLRPHQQTGLDGLLQSVQQGLTRPLLAAPTGYGKTEVAAHLIAHARNNGRRIAFVVPALSLVDQTFDRLRGNGFDPTDMGVMQADHPWRRPHAPIQIATAQTLGRRSRPLVDEAIIDEAHMQHEAVRAWINDPSCAGMPFYGLSATPGSRGLGKLYTNLVAPITTAELIEQGYLAPMQVFAPSKPDLEGVATVGDDWNQGELAERVDVPHLVADVVETWLSRGAGRPTLCFATGRRHARSLYTKFLAAGVAAAYVDADTPREERDEIGRKLGAGELQVAVNIGCLTTGIDWDVRCIVLARPTKSRMLFVQMIGRGLRTADGKADCLILDHSDTHARLGMVTDIRFELDDGKPKPKAKRQEKDEDALPLPTVCPCCSALMPAKVETCPACGSAMPMPTIYTVDGKLTPFGRAHIDDTMARLKAAGVRVRLRDDGMLGAGPAEAITPDLRDMIAKNRDHLIRQLRAKLPAKVRLAEFGKQAVHAMLMQHADEHGYKPGWVAQKYRAIFDVWPRGLDEDWRQPPSPELRAWLTSERIKWASRKEVSHAAA